jgi:hypothetical protein
VYWKEKLLLILMMISQYIWTGRPDFGSLWELDRNAGEGISGGNFTIFSVSF